MSMQIICDGCGREITPEFATTVTVAPPALRSIGDAAGGEYHLCPDQDGASIGCARRLAPLLHPDGTA